MKKQVIQIVKKENQLQTAHHKAVRKYNNENCFND